MVNTALQPPVPAVLYLLLAIAFLLYVLSDVWRTIREVRRMRERMRR